MAVPTMPANSTTHVWRHLAAVEMGITGDGRACGVALPRTCEEFDALPGLASNTADNPPDSRDEF